VAMVSCLRCARSQRECRLSSLSSNCDGCTRAGKKCEPAVPVVHFSGIDRALAKLEKEEEEAEAAMDAAMELFLSRKQKLKRLRKQRRFLKGKEQKMFDKGLSDVEELERLEELEKAQAVEGAVAKVTSADELFDPAAFDSPNLDWLEGFVPETLPASQGN